MTSVGTTWPRVLSLVRPEKEPLHDAGEPEVPDGDADKRSWAAGAVVHRLPDPFWACRGRDSFGTRQQGDAQDEGGDHWLPSVPWASTVTESLLESMTRSGRR
jgi:hypothetical protein